MSKTYVNRITLIGNPEAERLNLEINNRFIADEMKNGPGDNYSVYRIFYGLSTEEAKKVNKDDEVQELWYSDDSEWEKPSTGFTIFSSPIKLDDLQNHILTFGGLIDAKLIVCNQVYNLPIKECSARFVVMDNGKLKEFTASAKIKLPKKHTKETDQMIDFVREEVKQEAFKKMMKKVSWITKEMYK
jgi:hypothetical protein